MEEAENKQRDIWSKVDVLIKASGVLLISGALTFYAIYSENRRADTALRVAQETSRFGLYADAMRNRQSTDAALKADLMRSLVERIFDKNDPKDRVVALELLAHNFHETFDFKPLFHRVDSELEGRMRQRLRIVANELSRRQIDRLVLDGAIREQIHVELKKEAVLADGSVVVELLDIKSHEVHLRVSFSMPGSGVVWKEMFEANRAQHVVLEFSLGQYDFPFVDYFTIGKVRYAFVLRGVGSENAAVDVIVYPRDYFDIQDRIRVNRLLGTPPQRAHD